MSDQFHYLCKILRGQVGLPSEHEVFSESCHVRLVSALQQIGKKNEPGTSDLASLVRHILRHEAEVQGVASQSTRIIRKGKFPDRSTWEKSGLAVVDETPNDYLIQAHAWQPRWLRTTNNVSPEKFAFAETNRRNYEAADGDPALFEIRHRTYRSIGQREAIRAALLAPLGSTLVINLPTGSGKSLCAQLPALMLSRDYGVTVVVVPTTALAIDQERAMASFINHPTAYYGSNSADGEERRRIMRERIRDGSQRIVFTSPESVLESLAPSLYKAAENGLLRLFVIDEAHMVEQWGDDFRPAFQELPGIRKDLLRVTQANPFNTLLMTGTLTQGCLDTLESLYGEPGPFDVVSAAQLRPEPSYWFTYCDDEDVKHSRVMEAMRHLPRPLILYTTRRNDAEWWGGELRRNAFTRFAVMTGASPTSHRVNVIEQWRTQKIDVVIATAAFGLGVDQSDVRAVVHACIPETLDRFYQEVGRGGRDGKASVSLLAYTRNDYGLARSVNERVSIGVERGLQRWERMFASKEQLPNQRLRVRVDVTPSNEPGDIDMNNERNRKWNIRTLTLMSCAKLIEMDAERPTSSAQQSLGATSKQLQSDTEKFQSHQNKRVIRIRDENHLQEDLWNVEVEAIRERRARHGKMNLKLMEEALKGNKCIAHLLAEAYNIPSRTNPTHRRSTIVSLSCGGCPYCREHEIKPYANPLPVPRPAWQAADFAIGSHLQKLLGGEKLMIIFYSHQKHADEWEEQLESSLNWFIKQGVRNLVAPPSMLDNFRSWVERNPSLLAFFFDKFEPLRMPPAPSLIMHSSTEFLTPNYLRTSDSTMARILLLPTDINDPLHHHRRLADSFNGRSFSFEEFRTLVAI